MKTTKTRNLSKAERTAPLLAAAALATLLAWFPHTGAPASSHTAERSFSVTRAAPGENVEVTVALADYGAFAQFVETLPDGFVYQSSSVDERAVEVDGQTVSFIIIGAVESVVYTVAAPQTEGSYVFSGVVMDQNRDERGVAGETRITVALAPTPTPATPTPTPTPEPTPTPAPEPTPTPTPATAPTAAPATATHAPEPTAAPATATPTPATATEGVTTLATSTIATTTPAPEPTPTLATVTPAPEPTAVPAPATAAPEPTAVPATMTPAPEPTSAPAPETEPGGQARPLAWILIVIVLVVGTAAVAGIAVRLRRGRGR